MAKSQVIGIQRRHAFRRTVFVYDLPGKPDKVLTIGKPFDGGPAVECTEDRALYARAIRMYPIAEVYE